MKVLVTGANGQLGSDLCKVLQDVELVPLTHAEMDISNIGSVKTTLDKYRPDIVINTAAYVRVDECESNADEAYRVNAIGARNMAVATQDFGMKLAHISTDYVFGGESEHRSRPYAEYDSPIPLSTYGKSKLWGEELVRHLCSKHFIVRTSGLFGVAGSSGKGGNFVETMLRLAREREEIRVVDDQILSPTYTKDLAQKITQLIPTEYYGIFHITNRGACSWHQFTQEIFKLANSKVRLVPITSAEYPTPAKRPHFSVLDNYHLRLLGMDDMRSWQEALRDYMREKGHLR